LIRRTLRDDKSNVENLETRIYALSSSNLAWDRATWECLC
jgi:hypothetical protein